MSIVVESLTAAYGTRPVLHEVSLAARAGRITAVLGPNAAGKSTLLRCIVGTLRPRVGSVLIEGRSVHDLSPRDRAARLAYVPQRSLVAAAFTARDVIRLGRYALPPDDRRIAAAIARLDLDGEASRPFAELSVGQQQRVVLARAVAQVGTDGHLILDEPMAAMDLRHVREGLGVLRDLAASGATVIMAMHDVSLAALVADDVWLLDGGRVAAAGEAPAVLTPGRLEGVFGVPFSLSEIGDGGQILMPRILPPR
ncbi:MAG: ABC transporter ATP-binding protein [Planctomycetota bacterium]|jgi:iron complex transport system ATP-binding protein